MFPIARTRAGMELEEEAPAADAARGEGEQADEVGGELAGGDQRRAAMCQVGDGRPGYGEVELGAPAVEEPASVGEGPAKLRHPPHDRREVPEAEPLGDELPHPAPEDRMIGARGGLECGPRSAATGPPAEPRVL